MTDNEIMKALEWCSDDSSDYCCELGQDCTDGSCVNELMKAALDLIKRQQERMDGIVEKLEEMMQRHISEAKRQEEYGNYYRRDHERYAADTYKYFIKQLKEGSIE